MFHMLQGLNVDLSEVSVISLCFIIETVLNLNIICEGSLTLNGELVSDMEESLREHLTSGT